MKKSKPPYTQEIRRILHPNAPPSSDSDDPPEILKRDFIINEIRHQPTEPPTRRDLERSREYEELEIGETEVKHDHPNLGQLIAALKQTQEAFRDAKLARAKYAAGATDRHLERSRSKFKGPPLTPDQYQKNMLEEGELLKKKKYKEFEMGQLDSQLKKIRKQIRSIFWKNDRFPLSTTFSADIPIRLGLRRDRTLNVGPIAPPPPHLLPDAPPSPIQIQSTPAERAARIEYYNQYQNHPEEDDLKWDPGTQSWVPQ
jgi:hypothetical protein